MPPAKTVRVQLAFPELGPSSPGPTLELDSESQIFDTDDLSVLSDEFSELSVHSEAEHTLEVLPGAFDRCDSVPSFATAEIIEKGPKDKCDKCCSFAETGFQASGVQGTGGKGTGGQGTGGHGTGGQEADMKNGKDAGRPTTGPTGPAGPKRVRSAFQVGRRLSRTADYLFRKASATRAVAVEGVRMARTKVGSWKLAVTPLQRPSYEGEEGTQLRAAPGDIFSKAGTKSWNPQNGNGIVSSGEPASMNKEAHGAADGSRLEKDEKGSDAGNFSGSRSSGDGEEEGQHRKREGNTSLPGGNPEGNPTPPGYTRMDTKEGLKVVDANGNMLFHVFDQNTIPADMQQTLATEFLKFRDRNPGGKAKPERGSYRCWFLGIWNGTNTGAGYEAPYFCGDYRGNVSRFRHMSNLPHRAAKTFLHRNKPLFDKIAGLLRINYPRIYLRYHTLILPPRRPKVADPFCTICINENCTTLRHKDHMDTKDGVCVVYCWGDFKGGELVFDELKMVVPLLPGQLIFFRSAILTHWNQRVTSGKRNSFVLFTGSRVMDWFKISASYICNRKFPHLRSGKEKKRKVEDSMERDSCKRRR